MKIITGVVMGAAVALFVLGVVSALIIIGAEAFQWVAG